MKSLLGTAVLGCFFLSGCSATVPREPDLLPKENGLLSINRIAPKVSEPTVMLGFVPVEADKKDKWISIDIAKDTVALMEGESVLSVYQAQGDLRMKPGSYQLMHKQRSPLWYAGDSYFLKRGLPVPTAGDKERYRRGALGDFALFIDKDDSLHSAPVWSDEVGGLRINDLDIRKIYYSVDVGSRVEIK